jgi:hypothetical protein
MFLQSFRPPRGVSRQPVPNQRARWAFLCGIGPLENPYPVGSAEAIAWTANWFQEKQDMDEMIIALCHERGRLGK